MEQKFTIEEFKNYIFSQDSLGDAVFNISPLAIETANLIKEYNEEVHVGSDLEGQDLYTLDESEVEEFEIWKKEYLTAKTN